MSSILNAKEIDVNNSQIDFYVVHDYTSQINFYNNTPLMTDLGEAVKTYKKTYRIYEDSSGLLMSNGIFYDKISDTMHTQTAAYKNWYSKLILGYNIPMYYTYDFYASRMAQFTIIPEDDESFVVIRNKSIALKGFVNGGDLTIFNSVSILEDTKNLITYFNADTYEKLKVEYLHPHETQYSIKNFNKYTPYQKNDQTSEFENRMSNIQSRLNIDITGVANLAAGILFSAFGANKYSVIPVFLNMNKTIKYPSTYTYRLISFTTKTDNTQDILYHGYLGFEYLYDFKYTDQSNTIDVLNKSLIEVSDVSTDMLKYILPPIRFVNGMKLAPYDKYFGIARRDAILTEKVVYQSKSILSCDWNYQRTAITIYFLNGGYTYSNTYTISQLKSDFFNVFNDLSSDYISNLIDDIDDWSYLYINNGETIPILILDASSYLSLNGITSIGKIYLFSVIMNKISINFISSGQYVDSSSITYIFTGISLFETNIISLDLLSYDQLNSTIKYDTYVNKILALNMKFKVAPLMSNIFNPSIFDDIKNTSLSLSAYSGSSKFREDIDDEVYDSAEPDCKLEFDEFSGDNTGMFFLANGINDIQYHLFTGNDITTVQYQSVGPENVFYAEIDDDEQKSISNLKLEFNNDSTRLHYIPIDLEKSNIAKIPYKGLLLLNDIQDNEYIELDNLYLHRDLTSNYQQCKVKLLKYDQLDTIRNLRFVFYGNSEVSVLQQLAYEFGLGFELVSSENIDNIEIMRMLYILISQTQSGNNIFIEKVMQDPTKLKLIFKKLTQDPIVLRTILGYSSNGSIIGQTDTTI